MNNILVVDRERTSGYLVKSILLGRGCHVSLSATVKDARLKSHTGLFDALVVDVGEPEVEMPLIAEVQDLLPGFPVVAIFRDEPPSGPWISLRKPIRIASMADAVRHALGRSHGDWNRHDLDVAATVQVGAEFTECRVSTLSRHGILVGPRADFESVRRFHEFFHAKVDRPFEGRISFPGGEEEFHARAAYAETAPDSKVRQVALAFDADHDWFARLTPPAPAEPATPPAQDA